MEYQEKMGGKKQMAREPEEDSVGVQKQGEGYNKATTESSNVFERAGDSFI